MSDKTIIKSFSATASGVNLELTVKASLNGGRIKTKSWFVSWDKVGKALFGEQYSDSITVEELNKDRGHSAVEQDQ